MLSLAVADRGYSLVVEDELLIVVVSLSTGSRCSASCGCGLQALSTGPVVEAHGLCCSPAWALSQTKDNLPATAGRFFTTESPGKPYTLGFNMLCFQVY